MGLGAVIGAILGGGAAFGASKVIGDLKFKPKPVEKPPALPSTKTSEAKALEAARVRRAGIARNKSIYTSPLGLTTSADILKQYLGQ